MAGMDVNLLRLVRRLLPVSATPADGTVDPTAPRSSPYGEVSVLSPVPTKHLLADEGSYFVATNATPGTALAYPVQAAYTPTAPFLYIQNNDRTRNLWIDYVKLVVNIVPATAAQAYFAVVEDLVTRVFTTDNTIALPAQNPNTNAANPSVLVIKIQNNATASAIAAPSASARLVARGSFGGLPVVGDELVMTFGSADPGAYSGLTAAQATCPGRKVSNCAPLCVAPGHNAAIFLWFPGNATTGLSYETEVAGILR